MEMFLFFNAGIYKMVGSVVFQESMALIYIPFVLLYTTEVHLGPTKFFVWGVGGWNLL